VVEVRFPYKLKVPASISAIERGEYMRNLSASIEFELKVKQSTISDESNHGEYKEPKVFSWNLTYADSQVIRV
jgi:hypothetical protein